MLLKQELDRLRVRLGRHSFSLGEDPRRPVRSAHADGQRLAQQVALGP
jgi:hypothetical protein